MPNIINYTGKSGISALQSMLAFVRGSGNMAMLSFDSLKKSRFFFRDIAISIEQMYIIGIESFPLVLAVSSFIGIEVVLQAEYQFRGLIPLRYLGYAVCKSIITEFGPVLSALTVAGRVATSMGGELANMKQSEQLDAMLVLNLDSTRYLIMPRILGAMLMFPMLVIFSDLQAILTSIVTTILFVDVSLYEFLTSLKWQFRMADIIMGVLKPIVFGGLTALAGCYCGLTAERNAQAVGKAAGRAVLLSSVLILFSDFIFGLFFTAG